METDRIVRLYAHDGEERVRLGVLMPETRAAAGAARGGCVFLYAADARHDQSGRGAGSAGASGGKKRRRLLRSRSRRRGAVEPFSGRILTARWKTRGCGGRRTARSLTWIMSRGGNFR